MYLWGVSRVQDCMKFDPLKHFILHSGPPSVLQCFGLSTNYCSPYYSFLTVWQLTSPDNTYIQINSGTTSTEIMHTNHIYAPRPCMNHTSVFKWGSIYLRCGLVYVICTKTVIIYGFTVCDASSTMHAGGEQSKFLLHFLKKTSQWDWMEYWWSHVANLIVDIKICRGNSTVKYGSSPNHFAPNRYICINCIPCYTWPVIIIYYLSHVNYYVTVML